MVTRRHWGCSSTTAACHATGGGTRRSSSSGERGSRSHFMIRTMAASIACLRSCMRGTAITLTRHTRRAVM